MFVSLKNKGCFIKGIGALFVKDGIELSPILTGGHHERRLRAGTENIAAIVG